MSSKRDYYEILGVSRGATKDEIKSAYRKAALQFHPDRNKEPGAEEKFKEAAEAYEVLSDDQKRSSYDRFGHDAPRQGNWSYHDPADIFASIFGSHFGFSDFFGNFGRHERGSDLHVQINLSLEDVAQGIEKQIGYIQTDPCSPCFGKGGRGPSCSACGGYGQVQQRQGPFITSVIPCPQCNGQGIKVDQKCEHCNGKGVTEVRRTVAVKIPAGVEDGEVLRLRGEGNKAKNSPMRGDVICHIKVLDHPVFQRDGMHLIVPQKINFADAALGCSVEVPTISGEKIPFTIPPGTQFGEIFKIPGKGLPGLRPIPGARVKAVGDQLVQIFIDVPKTLSDKASQCLREFARLCKE